MPDDGERKESRENRETAMADFGNEEGGAWGG